MCHITIDVPPNPVSNVFAGPPITVSQPMTHEYWGNCNLCHKVTGGFQPPAGNNRLAAAQAGPPPIAPGATPTHPDWGPCQNCHQVTKAPAAKPGAQPAAFTALTAASLGLKLQTVTGAQMKQLGLANEDGVLVLEVAPGSLAARAGILAGDELIRVNKSRLDTVADFEAAVATAKAGQILKINLFRGTKSRNIRLALPEIEGQPAAFANRPEIEARPEGAPPLGPPPSPAPWQQPAVGWQQQAIPQQPSWGWAQQAAPPQPSLGWQQPPAPLYAQPTSPWQQSPYPVRSLPTPAAILQPGKVAVAAMGPDIYSRVAPEFGANPYFIVYDPQQNSYQSVVNPNFNDLTGRDMQSAQYLIDIGAGNVIAGSFSATGNNTLHNLRLNIYPGVAGTVIEAVSMYRAGQLRAGAAISPTAPLPQQPTYPGVMAVPPKRTVL